MEPGPGPPDVASANEEAIEAWDGVLFDRFVKFRHIVTTGLGQHGEVALKRYPPQPGQRVVDIGCGFGDTTQRLGQLVGPDGEAVGIDASERFIDAARTEAEEAGAQNVSFLVGDVQATAVEGRFDYAFSRFGVMFFANPVAAMRNIRAALKPGGRFCAAVWRRKVDNEWAYRAEQVVERFVTEDEDSDEPTCGPGPFSMGDANTTGDILTSAGFEDIVFHRCDLPYMIGRDLDEAADLVMSLGPAGEVIRLAGDEAERLRPEITAAVQEALSEFLGPEGVAAPSATWIVAARTPAD